MKQFTAIIFLTITLILPAFVYADGCSLTKTLYDNKNYKKALNVAKTYAQYDDICAKFYLGVMYYNGFGTQARTQQGHKLIVEAMFKGYKPAVDYIQTME